jgi:hypothetical protein
MFVDGKPELRIGAESLSKELCFLAGDGAA